MRKTNWLARILRMHALAACAMLASAGITHANGNGGYNTHEPPQAIGDSPNTNGEWSVDPILTIGEQQGQKANDWNGQKLGYSIPGILDGIGAYQVDHQFVRVVVNHELGNTVGAVYTLSNGTSLTGARISFVDINRYTRKPVTGGLAYDTIYDRHGAVVTSAAQLEFGGLARLCSGTLYEAEQFGNGVGFATRIYLTGEETSSSPGGSFWALDLDNGELWACPDLGRGAWENATILDSGRDDVVALLLADDTAPRPMYLYVGMKDPGGNFLEQNGLSGGQLFAWKSDSGDLNPSTFGGNGSTRSGTWVPLANTGMGAGYVDGYATNTGLLAQATGAGAFLFSRPEDVATNPADGTQAVFASTGRSNLFGGADSWGTIYVFDNSLSFNLDGTLDAMNSATQVTIVYDCNATADFGIRSPDNLDWADNGMVYIQEDAALSAFGQSSGIDASVWELDPSSSQAERILEVDRTAVPTGQTDTAAGEIGAWETSGVVDVTELFPVLPGTTLLIFDTQAHGVEGGLIDSQNLVEGGQLNFALHSPAQNAVNDLIDSLVDLVWPF